MYNISLENYEGPFDLLYDLISKNKMEIWEISISSITEQFVEYTLKMEELDMEEASDFLLVAARLLEMKSRYLLKRNTEQQLEIEDEVNLFEQVMEYRKYKNAASYLKSKEILIQTYFTRSKMEFYFEETLDLSDLTLEDLIESIPKAPRTREKEVIIEERNFSRTTISVEEQMEKIRDILIEKTDLKFSELQDEEEVDMVVADLLSILELAKTREIDIIQKKAFEEISIKKVEDFDE